MMRYSRFWAVVATAAVLAFGLFTDPRPVKAYPATGQWSCSLDDVGATLTLCQEGVEPGVGHFYITDIAAQSTTATAGLFLVRAGTGTNCGTGTVSVFPAAATVPRVAYPGNSLLPLAMSFTTPIKVPANKDICVIGTATNTVTVQIQGTMGS
jgi:hypothetical protein